MTDFINVSHKIEQLDAFVAAIREWARQAARLAIKVVQANVIDLTPVGQTKKLRSGILTREDESVAGSAAGAMQGAEFSVAVYAEGVVPWVHENNGNWTKAPPYKVLIPWVEFKLGLTGKEASSAAFAIAQKIKHYGLTLPNRQGMGQMFRRTTQKMESTKLWYHTFKAALRSLIR